LLIFETCNLFAMKKILLFIFLLFLNEISFGKTTVATVGTYWVNNAVTDIVWSSGAPISGDRVIFNSGTSIGIFGAFVSTKIIKVSTGTTVTFGSGAVTISDSLIMQGTTGSPGTFIIQGQTLTCKEIVFSGSSTDGAQFQVVTSATINLTGTMSNTFGLYTAPSTLSNAILNLSGTSNQSIVGSGFTLNLSGKTAGTVNLTSAFSTTAAITIPSGVTLNTNGFGLAGSGSLTVSSGGILSIGGTSTFPTKTTTLSSGSTINYSGAAQTVSNKAYYNLIVSGSGTKTVTSGATVEGIVTVNGTANLACGTGNLTILSTSAGTGAIGQVSGSVSGSPTIQRYVSDMSAAGNPGWFYFLGAPVSGQTIANINDDVVTTGFTGSNYPTSTFNSVSRWNGSAYVGATNVTNAMNVGEGWFVYLGTGGSALDLPDTISWTGAVTTGDYSGFSMSSSGAIYNSLSNPYPSAVTFNLTNMGATNLANPYVANNDGSFLALTDGSTLGLAQGFYIESTGGTPTLTFHETDKLGSIEGNSVFNKSSNTNNAIKNRLTAEITKVNGVIDFSYLELDDTKTLGMDYPADFDKYENFNGFTNVFFKMNGHDAHINNIPSNIGSGVSIPIHLSRAYPNGTNVTLPFALKGIEDFRNQGICLTLEETSTGNMTTLMNDYSNTIVWNDQDTAAVFVLHLSKAFEETTTNATCYGFEDGSASASTTVTAKYDFYLKSLIGDTLQAEMGKVANTHTFNNVAAGKYNLVMNDPNGCGVISKPITIEEPEPVTSFFTAATSKIDLSVNPEVNFKNYSANASTYLWQFGDGNTSVDLDPSHTYNAVGNYKVNLIAFNGACTDTSFKSIEVENNSVGLIEIENQKNMQLFQRNEHIELRFTLNQRELINARLVNVLGQEIWSSQGKQILNEQLEFDLPEENTFYLLNVKGTSFETNYKLIRR